MIAALSKSYRGISCVTCAEPIAIPSMLEAALENDVETWSDAASRQTFIARCSLCENESRYSVADVRTFDGEPLQRRSKARAARKGKQ
jgi:hypothetical protein